MILLLDNYDSFIYILAQYTRRLGFDCKTVRSDAITIEEIRRMRPSHIIISPGPCTPNEAGISIDVVRELGSEIPILGVCLGHQAIGQAFGGKITHAKKPMHGRAAEIKHDNTGLFESLDNPLTVGRYHSLVVERESLPDCLSIQAISDEGDIMAFSHKHYPIYGVQFHPESILTKQGLQMLEHFFAIEYIPAIKFDC